MINSKMICKIMGSLFFIEAGFLILCALLAIYYKETDLTAFLSSAAITAGFPASPMPFLKPCRDSPLPEQAFWIISNHCPTDYFSGEA